MEILGVNPSARLEILEKAASSSLTGRMKKILKQLGLSFVFKITKRMKVCSDNGPEKDINISDFAIGKCEPNRSLDIVAVCRKT